MNRVIDSNGGYLLSLKLIAVVMGLGLFGLLLWAMQSILLPLLIACVFYSLLEPLTNRLIGYQYSPGMAITVVLLGVLFTLVFLSSLLLPVLFNQIVELKDHIPQMLQVVENLVQTTEQWLSQNTRVSVNIMDVSGQWISSLKEWGASAVFNSAGFIVQFAMIVVLVPLITFFLLRDYRKIRNHVFSLLPNDRFELGWITYHRITQQLQNYVKGVVTQSLIVALISSFGFYLVGLDKAILFGSLTGVLNIIPYIGPLIAAVLPIFVAISTGSFDVWLALGVLGVLLLVQIIDNVFIIPSVIAGSIGLHPLLVLFGVIIFGSLFGLLGMLLAIPVLATVKILLLGITGRLTVVSRINNSKSMLYQS